MSKYQNNNTNTNRAKREKIRTICYIITMLAFIYLLGIVGGFENDIMTFKQFILQAIVTCTIMGVSARVGYSI